MPFRVRSALPLATERTQECLWNLAYDERRMAIVLELTVSLEEEAICPCRIYETDSGEHRGKYSEVC